MPAAARVTWRGTRWGAVIWGSVFGLLVFGTAYGYESAYKTTAERANLAATLGTNPGLRTLFGPARAVDTAAGFTAWRCLGLTVIMGGAWAILAATRALRGEEENGRWELVLGGPVTKARATLSGLGGLGLALAVLWVGTAAGALLAAATADVDVGSALFLSLAIVLTPAVFVGVGAVAAQLASTRRLAATIAGATFGTCYVVRMIASSGTGAGWLRWLTPLGWVYELRPMTGNRPLPLLLFAALIVALALTTVRLAGRRDLGVGVLPDRSDLSTRPRPVHGPLGLAVRTGRAGAVGWVVGAGAGAFVSGVVAKAAADAMRESSGVAERLARLGAPTLSTEAYIAIILLLVGAVVGLVAAGQVSAAWEEESSGALDHLLARPVSRARWLLSRVAVAVAEVIVVGAAVGAAVWLGAATQQGNLSFGDSVLAGLNLVPVAIAVLGIGFLFYGFAPRIAAPIAYAVVAWSFLVEFVVTLFNAPGWILDLSLIHHVALAPVVAPRWGSNAVLAALGAVGVAVGLAAFRRRDLVAA